MEKGRRANRARFDPTCTPPVEVKEEEQLNVPKVLSLISSSDPKEREYGCNTVSICMESKDLRVFLIKHGVVNALTSRLADPNPFVIMSALGALRNLSIIVTPNPEEGELGSGTLYGQLMGCQALPLLTKNITDSLTALSALPPPPSSSSSSLSPSEKKKEDEREMLCSIVESSFFLLLFLVEEGEEGEGGVISPTNYVSDPQRGVIEKACMCLQPSFPPSLRVSSAQLLYTLSDANDMAIDQIQNQTTLSLFRSILSSPPSIGFNFDGPSSVGKEMMICALSAGVLANLCALDVTASDDIAGIMSLLGTLLSTHIGTFLPSFFPIVNRLTDLQRQRAEAKKNGEEEGKGKEEGEEMDGEDEGRLAGVSRGVGEENQLVELLEGKRGEWRDMGVAQTLCLEIMTNLFGGEEEDEEGGGRRGGEVLGKFLKDSLSGVVGFCGGVEGFVEAGEVAWARPMFVSLQSRALICLSNIFGLVHDPSTLGTVPQNYWGQIMAVLTQYVETNEVEVISAGCRALWSLLRMCDRLYSSSGALPAHSHVVVAPKDVIDLVGLVKKFIEEEEIAVSCVGCVGCVVKHDCRNYSKNYCEQRGIPFQEEQGKQVIEAATNLIFGISLSDRPHVVAEAVNTIFELYGEDYHDEVYKQQSGSQKLPVILNHLRKLLGKLVEERNEEGIERVEGAVTNLEAFLEYKANN